MGFRALRGATTVEDNTKEQIFARTKELVVELIKKNDLVLDDVASIIFTATSDANAAFPAAAVREIGITEVPLMCMSEIDVEGSLEKCIRVLVHFNTEKTNKELNHVYLHNAIKLRPDLVS